VTVFTRRQLASTSLRFGTCSDGYYVRTQEFHLKMEGLKQRREDLENKELELRRSLEKFNTFLTVTSQYTG